MEHALPRRTAGIPRTWSLCMTSENHGTVGPAGCKFSHAPEKHERVLVVEVPAAAGAPVDQVNLKLVSAPVTAQASQVAAPKTIHCREFHELAMTYRAAPPFRCASEAYQALVTYIDAAMQATTSGERQEGGAA
jgi:hypothetical protein